MSWKEADKKLYELLFAGNLNSIEKYERLKDLMRDLYDKGYKDGAKTTDDVYQALFESDYYDDY